MAGASERTAALRSATALSAIPSPAAVSCSTAPGEPSSTSTWRNSGRVSASSATVSAWVSVSTIATTAPESCSTQRTCSAEEVS